MSAMSRSLPTIPSVKQGFLSTQTNYLSQTLGPSRAWQETNEADEQPLPTRVVEDALFNLNHAIQTHCRRVHAPPATRAVAEQIADNYMDGGREDEDTSQWAEFSLVRESNTCKKGSISCQKRHKKLQGILTNVGDAKTIASLPPKWPSVKDARAFPPEAKQYEQLVNQLNDLNAQRQDFKLFVDRLQRIAAQVEVLRMQDGRNSIQRNLITRNGDVEKELERMRILLTRVTGRIDQLSRPDEIPTAEPVHTQTTDVEQFLDGSKLFPRLGES